MAKRKPIPKQGARGTEKTRRMQLHFATHLLQLTEDCTIVESAEKTGLTTNDVKNLRAGNMPGLRALIAVVRTLRKTPSSLLGRGPLKPLPKSTRLTNATEQKVKTRIQRISRSNVPAELAAASGLSIASIYQYRSLNDKIGLHAYLAFVAAGHDADELLLGVNLKTSRA